DHDPGRNRQARNVQLLGIGQILLPPFPTPAPCSRYRAHRGTLFAYAACSPVVMIAIMAILGAKRQYHLRSFVHASPFRTDIALLGQEPLAALCTLPRHYHL